MATKASTKSTRYVVDYRRADGQRCNTHINGVVSSPEGAKAYIARLHAGATVYGVFNLVTREWTK